MLRLPCRPCWRGEFLVIKKTVRTKKRYIRFRCISEPHLYSRQGLENALRKFVLKCTGYLNNPYIKFVSYNSDTGEGVLKCSSKSVKSVLQSLVLFGGDKNNCRIKLVKTSGTLHLL